MKRYGGGVGMVVLVVVMAIVLFLAARAWKSVMPTATEVLKPAPSSREAERAGVPPAEQPAVRPSLRDMKESTDAHARDVADALENAK